MAGIEKRIEALEALIEAPKAEDPKAEASKALLHAIMDEVGRLKASRAHGMRGGVQIVPEDIPGKVLGGSYTMGDLVGLAVRRVAERELSGEFDEDEREEMIAAWTHDMRGVFERIGKGRAWDRVEGGA